MDPQSFREKLDKVHEVLDQITLLAGGIQNPDLKEQFDKLKKLYGAQDPQLEEAQKVLDKIAAMFSRV